MPETQHKKNICSLAFENSPIKINAIWSTTKWPPAGALITRTDFFSVDGDARSRSCLQRRLRGQSWSSQLFPAPIIPGRLGGDCGCVGAAAEMRESPAPRGRLEMSLKALMKHYSIFFLFFFYR